MVWWGGDKIENHMKIDVKKEKCFSLTSKTEKGGQRTVNIFGDGQVPRIIYLKMLFGDEYMDYIKDEIGVDKFLQNSLGKEDSKSLFLKDSTEVKEFFVNWIIFTRYYKERFGKKVRDKDAVEKLSKEEEFNGLSDLYDFRCSLFKADFFVDEEFRNLLNRNLFLLKQMNKVILEENSERNQNLIENKVW